MNSSVESTSTERNAVTVIIYQYQCAHCNYKHYQCIHSIIVRRNSSSSLSMCPLYYVSNGM